MKTRYPMGILATYRALVAMMRRKYPHWLPERSKRR